MNRVLFTVRVRNKRTNNTKWLGPFKIVRVDKKMAHLDYNGELKLYSIHKLKSYTVDPMTILPPPSDEKSQDSADAPQDDTLDLLKELETVMSRSDRLSKPASSLAGNFLESINEGFQVMLSQRIETIDPLSNSKPLKKPSEKKVKDFPTAIHGK